MKNGPYELVVAPNDFPGERYRGKYCYEHHLVFWMNTGHICEDGECIHHRNGHRRDNRFENLQLMRIDFHSALHARPLTMMKIVCAFCGRESEKEARQVRTKIKKGQKDFYCDRTCMAKHFGNGRRK